MELLDLRLVDAGDALACSLSLLAPERELGVLAWVTALLALPWDRFAEPKMPPELLVLDRRWCAEVAGDGVPACCHAVCSASTLLLTHCSRQHMLGAFQRRCARFAPAWVCLECAD